MNFKNIIFDYSIDLSENDRENLKAVLMESYLYFKNLDHKYILTVKDSNSSVWNKAVDLCIKYKMKPYDFVELCYDNCKNNHIDMRAYMLTGYKMEKLLQVENSVNKKVIPDLEEYMTSCIMFALNLLKLNIDDPMFVLRSPGYDIQPWVRIYLCNNDAEVMKRFKEKADIQFKEIDGLLKILKEKGFKYSL